MTDTLTLRIARIAERTLAEGPGLRFALWVQGCHVRCAGCCNPHLFDPRGGQPLPVAALEDRLLAARAGLEGITLLGGEPFEQATGLAALATWARELGLGVMTFTGHVLEDLRASRDPGVAELIDATDLLVDGRYERSLPDPSRRWVGSTNQRFHFLTRRYSPGIELVAPGEVERTVELHVTTDGTALVNGWPELRRPISGTA